MNVSGQMMFFSGIGHWELMVILLLVLLVFGARVPEVMRSLGKGVTQFKKGIRDVEDEIMTESLPEKPADDAGKNVSASAGHEEKAKSSNV